MRSAEEEAAEPFRAGVPVLAEEKVDFVRELAANVVRSPHGQAVAYPVVESVQVDGVCDTVIAPAPGLDEELSRPGPASSRCASPQELGVVGHLAVELFETRDGGPPSSSTNSPCARTTPATGRRTAPSPRSSPTTCAPSSTCRWATRARGRRWTVMANVLGGDYPDMYPAYLHCMARDPQLKIHMYGKDVKPGPQGRPRQHLRRRPGRRAASAPATPPDTCEGRSPNEPSCPALPEARLVGIVMGSDSDWPVMEAAAEALDEFEIPYEVDVVSAHRMPREMIAYGEQAAGRGLKAIIAGAGGAAHLPGMLASVTPLPVIGVPVPLKYLDGMDSLLSIVQMPAGVPVATVSVGGARNAGLLAARILAAHDAELLGRMRDFQQELNDQATEKGSRLRAKVDGRSRLRLRESRSEQRRKRTPAAHALGPQRPGTARRVPRRRRAQRPAVGAARAGPRTT